MSTITPEQRRRPSLFGPIVLIALGLLFLFNQLYPGTNLHWVDALRLWPLFLIFAGLNILVRQAPAPLGALLSGAVALLAVGVFAFILLVGVPGTIFGSPNLRGWQTEDISLSVDDASSAVLNLEIGPPGANLYALEDSQELIAGTVTYQDSLQFDDRNENGQVTVTLAPRNTGWWQWAPQSWDDLNDEARWDLGLAPDVPLSLSLNVAAGSSRLDLSELTLQDLSLDASASDVTVFLPDGDYDVSMATNAAATNVTLPQGGQQTIDLQVNAGAVDLQLPAGMEARVEVDNQALGDFADRNSALQRVGTSNVWQTEGYEDSSDRVTLVLDIAVGSVTMR